MIIRFEKELKNTKEMDLEATKILVEALQDALRKSNQTEVEIAKATKVSEKTINRWKNTPLPQFKKPIANIISLVKVLDYLGTRVSINSATKII